MLRVNEIFYSLQGESTQMGRPSIFIRLTGCKLRCTYCDTQYAYYAGEDMTIEDILEKIRVFPSKLIEVTGGEPLEQKEAIPLLERLVAEGYEVMIETDGVEDVSGVPAGVRIVFDVKTPGSGMRSPKTERMLAGLRAGSEVKFVLTGEAYYEFAKAYIEEYKLTERHSVLLSPAAGPEKNMGWLPPLILKDGLDVRFQPQLHKILWGERR